MILIPLLLTALGANDVDLTLTPVSLCAQVNEVVDLELTLSAGTAAAISAIDVILKWNPAELELQQALPVDIPWFVQGFLNDPDGINDDLTDGDAVFTGLANPGNPPSVPPSAVAVKFRFRVLAAGQVSIPSSLGANATTKVVGTSPGEILTGMISPPITISTAPATLALEVVRLGTPPNPNALLPGLTSGPVLGQLWDPVVEHTVFFPSALLDIYTVYLGSTNQASLFGTVLGATPIKTFFRQPSNPLVINIPDDCTLVGVAIFLQAASWDGNPFDANSFRLTNALDVTLGTF